jgi:hypothetical protein
VTEVTAGGVGAAVLGKYQEVEEEIPEAQKVSGHMREGHSKPREFPGNQTYPNQVARGGFF